MKEFKGSGPDWFRGGDKPLTYSDCVYDKNGNTVCEVMSINPIEDAQLIESAPNLLKVLMLTMDDIGHWLSQQNPELKRKIEDAIKKATGDE